MFHTEPRYTKDIDVWVRPTGENARRVLRALAAFGAPRADLGIDDLSRPGTIFQMGMAPNRIDVLTSVEALDFEGAWSRRARSTYGGVAIALLSLEDLLVNERAVARPQDLIDVERLEAARKTTPR